MKEAFQIIAIPFLLVLAAIAHVVPLALIPSAIVRGVLGWHSGLKWLGLAALAMLPQAFILLLAPQLPELTPYLSVPLVMAGMVAYWRATEGHRNLSVLLEAITFALALVYVLAGVNWIVH